MYYKKIKNLSLAILSLNRQKEIFEKLGRANKRKTNSFESHILPMKFLKGADNWSRQGMIQGFFDERASISKTGIVLFCSNNSRLLEQIVELCNYRPLQYKFTTKQPLIRSKSGSMYMLLAGDYKKKFLEETGFTIPYKIDRGLQDFGIDSRNSTLNQRLPLRVIEEYYKQD